MKILYGITATGISLLLMAVQLVCYVAVFGEVLRLGALTPFVEDVQDGGMSWTMFFHGTIFHFALGGLVFLVLVRIKHRRMPVAIDWWQAPLVFATVVSESGLTAICVFSLCSAVVLSASFMFPSDPEASVVLLWAGYVCAWVPFARKAWLSADRLKQAEEGQVCSGGDSSPSPC